MRNHPSVVYLRNHPVINSNMRNVEASQRDVTMAFKIVSDLEGLQHLVAAVAVPHPQENLITETLDTHIGLDSYPVDLETPRHKFPFVKSRGRDLAVSRLNEAIGRMPEETNFRGPGYVCVSNTNEHIYQGGYYQLMKRFIYVPEGQVIPFLDMAKPVLLAMATEFFVTPEERFEAWMGTSLERTFGGTMDTNVIFNQKSL